MMQVFEIASFVFASALRMSSPLIFAALGGIMSERSGVINISLEGKMLVGAFAAAVVTYYFHSPVLGLLGGALAGFILASIYSLFVISFKSNQIVTGTAINILAAGIVPLISQALFQNTGSTPEIPMADRFTQFPIILSWVSVVLIWAWFRYSPFGLWHQFAGEHPYALQTSGVDVISTRWCGVLSSGIFAGLGGATLSICLSSNFTRNMTAGRGFMALAALIVGRWRPMTAAVACIFFGLFDAVGITLQGLTLPQPDFDSALLNNFVKFFISTQFVQIIPYLLTVIAVAGFVGRSRPPKALGIPFLKNR